MTAITNLLSDDVVLTEIGSRIRRHRLDRNLTQAVLAAEAGVSLPTLQRIERGASVQWVSILRILRGLSMLSHIELLVPEPDVRPMALLQQNTPLRQRASGARRESDDTPPAGQTWRWGDET
ncbi:MAG: helix-turn-helix transcriptional regulator [Myxococcales bacterium]|nr:helix-turn-helix transcriptional regulator [Myxococcales bacterium]